MPLISSDSRLEPGTAMILSLRKGYAPIDLQYASTCDTIGAEKFRVEIREGQAIFCVSLRPSSGNQREDEENLHTRELLSLTIHEAQVLKNLRSFHRAHSNEYSKWSLLLLSRGKVVKFAAEPSIGPSEQLLFTVLRAAGD